MRRGASVVLAGLVAAASSAAATLDCPSSEQLQLTLVSVRQGGQPVLPDRYDLAPQGVWLWSDTTGRSGRITLSGVGPEGSYEESFVAR